MNNMHVIHMLICLIYIKIFESGIFMSGMSMVWEDTDGCANKYRCTFAVYLMNLLSSSYGIIMNRAINVPGHGNNCFDGLYATYKCYLKEKWNLFVNHQVITHQRME